jgi:hypothetical protein
MIGVGRKGSVQRYEIKHFDGRKFISAWTGSRLVPFGYLSLDNDSTAPMSDWGLGRVETLSEGIRWLWPAAFGDF